MAVLNTSHYTFRFSGSQKSLNKKPITFAVSSREVRLAVKRNLLKRRGRSIIVNIKDKILPGVSGIFYFKKSALTLSYRELKESVTLLLKRAKILKQ